MLVKRTVTAIVSLAIFLCNLPIITNAQDTSDKNPAESAAAKSVYVCETESGKVLYEKKSDEKMAMGHMAKLMTVLICAEEIEQGSISLEETVVISANANSKQGTQIWLDVGEKISVEELLKSIIIGNANDACTALAEKLSGSEEVFTQRINKRAQSLGMKNTYFADCTGMDSATVSTAHDIALLSCEVIKYNNLTGYFTTWIDEVRRQGIQLVNTNRLVRTYKGILGLKSCSSQAGGEAITACAKRGNLSVCAVLLGCSDDESKFTDATDLLDSCFDNFSVFSPNIDEKSLSKVAVNGGRKLSVSVKTTSFTDVIVSKNSVDGIEAFEKIAESVEAPVKKGDVLGTISYKSGDETLMTVEICAAEDVKRMNFGYAIKKCLLNLLNT